MDHDIIIGIGFLTSYEHMGMAHVECRSGCKCKRKELQGMIDVKASQTDWCGPLQGLSTCLPESTLRQIVARSPERRLTCASRRLQRPVALAQSS